MLVRMMCLLLATGAIAGSSATYVLAQDAQVGQVLVSLPIEQENWFVQGDVTLDKGEAVLRSTDLKTASITSKTCLANTDFTLSFDFAISSKDTTGQHNGMHVGYRYPLKPAHWSATRYLWDVDIASPRLLVRTLEAGKIQVRSLLAEDIPMDAWFHLVVRNSGDGIHLRLQRGSDNRLLASRSFPHDRAPQVAQPIRFWADSELFGTRPKAKPPVIGVFAPYNQYKLANEWSPYIKVGGSVRSVSITRPSADPLPPGVWREVVDGGRLALAVTADRRVFLLEGRGGRTLLEMPGPTNWPWRVTRVDVNHRQKAVTQTWKDPSPDKLIRVSYSVEPGKPYIRVRTTAVNTLPGARKVDFAFAPSPTSALPYSAKAFTFPWVAFDWARYYANGAFDFDLDLASQPVQCNWGIAEFSWGEGPGIAPFLPIIALRGHGDESLIVAWDNRASLGFRADDSGWSVTRRLYLDKPQGSVDAGFDVQDGDGLVPHEMIIGYTDRTDWPTLVNDFYLDAYPLYVMERPCSAPRLVPGLQGSYETFFTSVPWTQDLARTMALEGARYVQLFFGHSNLDRYAREFGLNSEGAEVARRFGLQVGLSDNIAVAPQPMPITDPRQCYTNFSGSWVYSEAGEGPFINWEGVTVNQSPKYGFGSWELKHHEDLIRRYAVGWDYMDLYYCWGTDYGRSYRHYGFYPMIVGINEWMRQKSAFLRSRGIPYVLNAPHRHSSLVRFGDIVQGDIGDIESFPVFHKVQSGGRLLRTYGSPTESAYDPDNPRYAGRDGSTLKAVEFALFNGMARQGMPPDDTPADERKRALDTLNRNVALGFAVGQARLVDGDVFRQYRYAGLHGESFVTVRSHVNRDSVVECRFSSRQHIKESQSYSVFEWDAKDGASLLRHSIIGRNLLEAVFSVRLDPQQAKVLIALPADRTLCPGYLAWSASPDLLVKWSTGEMRSVIHSGEALVLSVWAIKDRVTTTRIATPAPRTVSVTGATGYDIVRGEGYIDVVITHGLGAASVSVGSAEQ